MLEFSRIRKQLPKLIVLFVILCIGGVFFFRPPVLVVTDPSFIQLYGPLRLRLKGFRTSLGLFRRVKVVEVAESAGPDLISLAVEAPSRSPLAVLFPSRYLEGARLYKEKHPVTPVLVTGVVPRPAEEAVLTVVSTDTVQDLYRAGICAATLAGEKRVIFFSADALPAGYREAFREGLKSNGFSGESVFLISSADYSSYSEVGCVVITGQAAKFLEQRLAIPVILFSWADPAQTPWTVKIVFDDSPLALAKEALGQIPPPVGEILIPSEPRFLYGRMDGKTGEKKDFRKLREKIKEKFDKK